MLLTIYFDGCSYCRTSANVRQHSYSERITEKTRCRIALIKDCQSLLAAIEEQSFKSCNGNHIHLREILFERAEKSDRNDQYEVLSSTVTGIYSQREYFNKDIASADNTGYKIIHRGDIVLSPQNLWMGNINYNDCFEVGIVSPSYKVFSVNSLFDKDFIACLLKTKRAQWEYSQVSEQGASIVRRNLNIENFLDITFTIPALEEQRRIGQRISAVSNKIGLEQQFLNQLCSQKRYLLNSMFI